MALRVPSQVIGLHLGNAAGIDHAERDVAAGDQIAQPLRGKRIDLVVVRCHGLPVV
jgi:hypothetical protein